jgi:hypothetical protein
MHLITQPVHVLPCSNSVTKGNNGTNRILYHDIAAQTITEPPRVSLLEPGIPDCKLHWVFSNNQISGCREQREGLLMRPHRAFPVVWCPGFMAVTPSFTHLSITFSNRRFSNCGPTGDVGFVRVFMETGSSRWIFNSCVTFYCGTVNLVYNKRSSRKNLSPTFILCDTDRIENDVFKNPIVACIGCSGNVSMEPLPSNDRGINIQTNRLMGGI